MTRAIITLCPLLFAFLLLCSCRSAHSGPGAGNDHVEAISLLGQPLRRPALADDVRAEREANLRAAEAALVADPEDEERIVWLGRRQAYLGRYGEAIDTFTDGLALHPQSHVLRRHRGHRYLTVRRLDAAVTDLERASVLIAERPDVVEADGLPNALGIPTSTSHSNVWYHLGLARYVRGEFDQARIAYEQCMLFSNNPDMRVATSYWLYRTLRRLGRDAEARALLEPITPDLEIIENHAYHQALLLERGDLTLDEVLDENEPDAIQSATLAYGIARWHIEHGRIEEGRAMLETIVAGEAWPAFGHLAAEADLAGGGGEGRGSRVPESQSSGVEEDAGPDCSSRPSDRSHV